MKSGWGEVFTLQFPIESEKEQAEWGEGQSGGEILVGDCAINYEMELLFILLL
jgi:hypothetical protein